VVEGAVNRAIRYRRSTAQAFEVFQIAIMQLSTSGKQRVRASLRPGKTKHLMGGADQFLHHGEAYKSRSSGNENTHVMFPFRVCRFE
jgi:hypothetical protein